jgi:hypothetical protein
MPLQQSQGLQWHLTVSTSTLITFTCTLTDLRGLLEAHEGAFRGRKSVCRGLCEIKKNRNESTNVPISKLRIKTKSKRFDVFQNLKWNVSIYSKNFGTKPKLFNVFKLLFCKSNVSIYSKNFGTKPKLFDVFQLFLAKAKH